MSKHFGLDLGTNSVGWVLFKNEKIEEKGLEIFPKLTNTLDKKPSKYNNSKSNFSKFSRAIKRNSKPIILYSITLTMFSLSLAFPNNWQFWLNLSIGGFITALTMSKN